MQKKSLNIGFIGAGFMGYGIALNLIKNKYNVFVVAHKNRKPINKLIKKGAKEKKNIKELAETCSLIIMCVTNTPIAKNVINKIIPYIDKNSTIIDITTHKFDGSIFIYNKLKKHNINYIESPVMGGPVQAEKGILGAIVGCDKKHFARVKKILMSFCKDVFYFGEIGMGAKAKLISNFLSLGTTTFVIESLKAAKKNKINIKKFYEVAKLGSGNSGALNRIAPQILNNNYKGYIFTVNNTIKDLTYIKDLLENIPNAKNLTSSAKLIYEKAKKKGYGNKLISELIKK